MYDLMKSLDSITYLSILIFGREIDGKEERTKIHFFDILLRYLDNCLILVL
jgi:hypothetical protein